MQASPLASLGRARSRAGLWLRHIAFIMTPAGQGLLAAKRRRLDIAWSDTLPSESGSLFRLRAWPELMPSRRREGWLPVLSALSVKPFSFDELVALADDDPQAASALFVELMVGGYVEVFEAPSPCRPGS